MRWWAVSVVVMIASLLWWLGLFAHADQIQQWLGAGEYRGGGGPSTLAEALQARRAWIDFSFTPLAIALGKIPAAPVCLLRWIASRRDEGTYALGLLFGAVVQYVAFKKGADVHIFWPHYFAAYFALALAELTATVAAVADGAVKVVRGTGASRLPALALDGDRSRAPVVAMTPDGVRSLRIWRSTGGRYDEHGSAIRSDVDVLYVLQEIVLPRTRRGTPIDTHPSLGWGWEFLWKYQGTSSAVPVPASGAPADTPHPFWIARASGLDAREQRVVAAAAHVRAYGDAWIVDQRQPRGADRRVLAARARAERLPSGSSTGTSPFDRSGRAPIPGRRGNGGRTSGSPRRAPRVSRARSTRRGSPTTPRSQAATPPPRRGGANASTAPSIGPRPRTSRAASDSSAACG